jgi:hypothetical protein
MQAKLEFRNVTENESSLANLRFKKTNSFTVHKYRNCHYEMYYLCLLKSCPNALYQHEHY